MFFVFDSLWDLIAAKLIWGTVRLSLKLTWFLARIAWYLSVFLILSAGAGITALLRRGHESDELTGIGDYGQDSTIWRDRATGIEYPCSTSEVEHCTVRADEAGMYWRSTALARLMKGPAILRSQFTAISEDGPQPENVIASVDFPQEARKNITLDHLDPAAASADPYGLGRSRDWATEALDDLDMILAAKGWQPDGAPGQHWYSRRYQRPVICWDRPLGGIEPAAVAA
jgi:hypothetical protein